MSPSPKLSDQSLMKSDPRSIISKPKTKYTKKLIYKHIIYNLHKRVFRFRLTIRVNKKKTLCYSRRKVVYIRLSKPGLGELRLEPSMASTLCLDKKGREGGNYKRSLPCLLRTAKKEEEEKLHFPFKSLRDIWL